MKDKPPSMIEKIMAEKPEILSNRVREYFRGYLRMIQDPENEHYKTRAVRKPLPCPFCGEDAMVRNNGLIGCSSIQCFAALSHARLEDWNKRA